MSARIPFESRCSWDVGLPPKGPRFARIERARLGLEKDFLVVNDRPRTVLLHFFGDNTNKGRSYPCTKLSGHCPGCAKKCRSDWKSYLGAWNCHARERSIVELTAFAVRNLSVLNNDLDNRPSLRGLTIRLHRLDGHVRGKVWAKLDADPPKRVPVDQFDVVQVLGHMWGLEYHVAFPDNVWAPELPGSTPSEG